MRKGGAENIKRLAYERAVAILKRCDLTPLFDLETYQTDRSKRQWVRCNKCGYVYGALIHKTRTTPCPRCASRARELVLDTYYERALETVRNKGYEPLFSRADFRGFKEKDNYIPYPVRCKKCGGKSDVWVHPDFIKNCPYCSSKKDQSYNSFVRSCEKYGFTPITTLEDWEGHRKSESYVRCNTCGAEFSMKWRQENKIICKVCHANMAHRNAIAIPEENILVCNFTKRLGPNPTKDSRNSFIAEALEAQGLIPLFDVANNDKPINASFPVKCKVCGHEFETQRSRKKDAPYFRKCSCQKAKNIYVSHREIRIREYLKDSGIHYLACDRDALHGTEVDILIPGMGIAFEFNGTFFHSSSSKNPKCKSPSYHTQKTSLALANGIKLYHLWEDTPDELVKSIIEAKLGRSQRVYARSLEYTTSLERSDFSKFFNENHVDGNNAQASYYFALTGADDRIMCALSLLRRRLQRSGATQWEIGRFANLRGYTVVGGYSRLLSHAVCLLRKLGADSLVSYCNRDLSPDPNDTFYAKSGFELLGDSGPIYWYVTQTPIMINGCRYVGRVPRQAVQKHKLLEHYKSQGLEVLEGDTERSLCERIGLLPMYNSGNYKFVLKLQTSQ